MLARPQFWKLAMVRAKTPTMAKNERVAFDGGIVNFKPTYSPREFQSSTGFQFSSYYKNETPWRISVVILKLIRTAGWAAQIEI